MATQGLLSITDKGRVTAKIITGSDGQYIPNLKLWLLENRNAEHKEIFEKAKELFGTSSLILQSSPTDFMADESIFDEASESILKPESLYQSKFNDHFFNPRWIYGSADHTEIVETSPSEYLAKIQNAESRVLKRSIDTIHVIKPDNRDGLLFLSSDSYLYLTERAMRKRIATHSSPYPESLFDTISKGEFDTSKESLSEISSNYFPFNANLLRNPRARETLMQSGQIICTIEASAEATISSGYTKEGWNTLLKGEIKTHESALDNSEMSM